MSKSDAEVEVDVAAADAVAVACDAAESSTDYTHKPCKGKGPPWALPASQVGQRRCSSSRWSI